MLYKSFYSHFLLSLVCSLTLLIGACGGGGGGSSETPETQEVAKPNPPANPPAPPVTPTPPPPDMPPPNTEIKLLALYTTGVSEQFNDPDLRIQHLVNVANDVLEQSGVTLSLVLDHLEWVDYPDQNPIVQSLDDLTLANHPAFEHIPDLRNQTQADLVILVRPYASDGLCGYAWIGGFQTDGDFSNPAEADYGYSVVSSNCSDYTLIHEVGHNLGLGHSRRESPEGGTFDYAVGHGMDSDFVTIMASPTEFDAAQLPKLSSPMLTCNNTPCGIAHTDPDGGSDAVRAINISKQQVANYR